MENELATKETSGKMERQFQLQKYLNTWTRSEKATAQTLALRGDAIDILQTLSPTQREDYLQLVKHLEMRYGETYLEHEFKADIARLVRLVYLATPEKVMESLAVQAFLDGLRDYGTR
ncbi:hypothetical protein NQ317_010047 [Molorchus minor]|uniref:Uncharacterized protein n=1 Tax=Molorchus minor TaxID=1323400 RepID=A0ABQ9IQF8_9CUCU|nr:hypothetical protein NQ317_010047 [Molorchus minor]